MKQHSLRTQILIFFLISISALFGLQMATANFLIRPRQMRETAFQNEQLIQSRAGEIGEWLHMRVSELRVVSRYEGFAAKDSSLSMAYLNNLNEYYNDSNTGLQQPFLFCDTSGILHMPDGSKIDVSSREFFLQAFASEKEYTVSKPLILQTEWKRVVLITYPLYDDTNMRIGYLIGVLGPERLGQLLSDIYLYNGRVWIMDAQGRLLAEDNNHTHGDNVPECPQGYLLTKTASRIAPDPLGTLKTEYAGGDTLLYADIPYVQGWKLCILSDSKSIFASTDDLIRSMWLVWAALVFVIVLFVFYIVQSVVRPVKELANIMDTAQPNVEAPVSVNTKTAELRLLTNNYNKMQSRIHRLLEQVVEEQKAKQIAERRVLQAQINPHFLYNTLDTLVWKAMDYGAAEVADMVNALSTFFRLSLSGGREFITWDEEAEHVHSYLFIQQIRYRDKLDFNLYLDEEIKDCMTMKLLVQPLVENALYHGIKQKEGRGSIDVTIAPSEDGRVHVCVKDDGVGIPKERLEMIRCDLACGACSMGFGLCSTVQRLRLTFEDRYSVTIHSTPELGTTIDIYVPLEKKEELDV